MIILPNSGEAFDYKVDEPLDVQLKYNPTLSLPADLDQRLIDVASLKEKPDIVCGQRSSVVQLSGSFPVPNGFQVAAFQIKGHFFRRTEESRTIMPPQMVMYDGRGHPPMLWCFDEAGNIMPKPNQDIPSGPLLYNHARVEFSAVREMHDAGLPVVFPVALGLIKGMEFSVGESLRTHPGSNNPYAEQDKRYNDPEYLVRKHQVGFVIHGLYNTTNDRSFDQVVELARDMDSRGQRDFLEDFFCAYGRALRMIHEAGYIHAYPNADNISLNSVSPERQSRQLPNRLQQFPDYEIVFHDIAGDTGELIRQADTTRSKFLGHVVLDITNVTETLTAFYHGPEHWVRRCENMPSSLSLIVKKIERLWEVAYNAECNPTEGFFRGYLGDNADRLPSGFFEDRMNIELVFAIGKQGMAANRAGFHPNVVKLAETMPLLRVLRDMYL